MSVLVGVRKIRLGQGKQNVRASCPKGKLENECFPSLAFFLGKQILIWDIGMFVFPLKLASLRSQQFYKTILLHLVYVVIWKRL